MADINHKTPSIMKQFFFCCVLIALVCTEACTQSSSNSKGPKANGTKVGGRCEGCEAIHETTVAFEKLPSSITLPGYDEANQKIEINGTVYEKDGKTPAADVVIYVYHTDQKGVYPTRGDEKGWAKRHGYIRGWVKTGKDGRYSFKTFRPASYPNSNAPQHIHVTIKEPGMNEYYIDEFLFKDDPNLAGSNEIPAGNKARGGSGVIELQKQDNGIMVATRDIILGLNIPDYPSPGMKK